MCLFVVVSNMYVMQGKLNLDCHFLTDLHRKYPCCCESIQDVWHLWTGYGEEIWRSNSWNSTTV